MDCGCSLGVLTLKPFGLRDIGANNRWG
jgi:hypothetical protein